MAREQDNKEIVRAKNRGRRDNKVFHSTREQAMVQSVIYCTYLYI